MLQDTYFCQEAEEDIYNFFKKQKEKRVLVFPPFNNYKRFLVHKIIQDNFQTSLQTFSIGQGSSRRIVICYKSDYIGPPVTEEQNLSNDFTHKSLVGNEIKNQYNELPTKIQVKQRAAKSSPCIKLYVPPALRNAAVPNCSNEPPTTPKKEPTTTQNTKPERTKHPDREIYVPRHRRGITADSKVPSNKPIVADIKKANEIIENVDKTAINKEEHEKPSFSNCIYGRKKSEVRSASPEKKIKKIETFDALNCDNFFNCNQELLEQSLIQELKTAVGEVVIEMPEITCKTLAESMEVCNSNEFAHIIEIYNFPAEYTTNDIEEVFTTFKERGFQVKWVDDTHCLGVFSTSLIATEALSLHHPIIKTRSLKEASTMSKSKVQKTSEFLMPFKNRPETCTALARRLVSRSLGVKLKTAKQEREQEILMLQEAKEKRRLANIHRDKSANGIILDESVAEN